MRLQTSDSVLLFDAVEASPYTVAQATERLPGLSSTHTQIAVEELLTAARQQSIDIEQWIIFSNGLHAIVSVSSPHVEGHQASHRKPRLLTSFIARFKAATAKRINMMRNLPGAPVWERGYKEQRIRDDATLSLLREKISSAHGAVASSAR